MTITSYQPLQSFAQPPPPPQQRKQAFTFTLMIMTVAFATLLTIIRLTISTDLTVQTFAPPTIFDVTNANLRHSVPNNHVQDNSIVKSNEKRSKLINNHKLLQRLHPISNEIDGTNRQQQKQQQQQQPIINKQNRSMIVNGDRNSSQKLLNVDNVGKVAQSSSTSGGGIILTADQRYEKEYRDDPETDPIESRILAKVPRKPKLVFDKIDLEEAKKMRIDKSEGCGEGNGSYADLMVIVNSAAYNFDARSAIRETWGKFAVERGAYFYFLVGSTDEKTIQDRIESEDRRYNDMLQASFFDSYHNLTLKTISMMRWVADHCSNIRYVLKVDDDMMLNMQHIADFAEINPNFHRVIIGKLAKRWRPHRDRRNKWYVPMAAFGGSFFPNFVTGPAYFFTGDAARPLYETAFNDQSPLYLEDVYMTGIVAEKAGIKRFNHALIRNIHLQVNECTYPKLMTSHKHKPDEIRSLWKLVYSKKCVPPKPTPTNTTAKTKVAAVPVQAQVQSKKT